ncbi:MAG: FAD-dependent oxidoreductase, partial [Candidatus Dormiibacterota bacterium]
MDSRLFYTRATQGVMEVPELRPTDPVWGTTPRDRRGTLPERADVLVIGGGIAGVSLLYWLRRSRRQGVLVERDRLAAGASGANAGIISASAGEAYATGVRDYGREAARTIVGFSAETHDLLEEALQGRSPHHRRRGRETWPVDSAEARVLEESAELLREDGYDAVWDGRRFRQPRDGEHNPVETVLGIAADATPGAIREGVEVTALEASAGGVLVEAADRSTCRAETVVVALNAYTPQLLPEVPIAPTRAQAVATAPIEHLVAPCPQSRDHGYQYWNQLWDGRVVAGGFRNLAPDAEVGYERNVTPALQAALDRHLTEIGAGAPVTHRWAGIMGFTKDGLPLAGP